jgi:acyl carrier protein
MTPPDRAERGRYVAPVPDFEREEPEQGAMMTQDSQILAGLSEILDEATAGDVREVTAEMSFKDDLELDSLTMVEIAVHVEEKLGVKIPDDDLGNLGTVGDMLKYIVAHSPLLS